MKDGTIENKGVEFAVFAAGVDVGRKIAEQGFIEFAASKAGVENFGVDACGDGAEMMPVEVLDQLAGVALPNGEERCHADAGKILLPIGAEIFEEDVAKGDFADALSEVNAQGFFHARFVDGIDALRRDENFMKGKADGFGLALEKFAADAVHGDAVVGFRDGREQRDDLESLLLE